MRNLTFGNDLPEPTLNAAAPADVAGPSKIAAKMPEGFKAASVTPAPTPGKGAARTFSMPSAFQSLPNLKVDSPVGKSVIASLLVATFVLTRQPAADAWAQGLKGQGVAWGAFGGAAFGLATATIQSIFAKKGRLRSRKDTEPTSAGE